MTSPVLTEIIETTSGSKIAIATLNQPDTLNGLTLPMCNLLTQALTDWEADKNIVMVVLRGAGDRAFCAGGDLHSIYDGMINNTAGDPWSNEYAKEFFDVEYRLDYQIHTYSKPIMCWGSGIVMGGGVGLMMGASHRVVTDTTRFAMPEITIGLFPDVGGTWMLSRLADGVGNFLALTGAQIGATDCQFIGLADYSALAENYDNIIDDLKQADWTNNSVVDGSLLSDILNNYRIDNSNQELGPLQQNYDLIRQKCGGKDYTKVFNTIKNFADSDDKWLQRASKTFSAGAPSSALLSFILLQKTRFLSLADVFRLEYIVTLQCGVKGNLQEGIRALLIDKDRTPKWNPATLEEVTEQYIQGYFVTPWPNTLEHPLADLGN